jgi:hypothetical protein
MLTSSSGFNAVLSGYASEWWNQNTGWVGAQLAPMFRTAEQAATYAVFNKENFLNRPTGIERAPGTPYSQSGLSLSSDLFNCSDKGHAVVVDETQRKKYRNQFDADFAAIARAMSVVRYNHEKEVKALIDDGSVPGSTPSTKWDASGSDPKGDIKALRKAFRDGSGLDPNTLTINKDVAEALYDHPDLVDLFKYSQVAVLGAEDIARVFKIPRVIIAGEYEESAQEGLTSSIAQIWSDDAIFSYTDPSQDLEAPNAFRTFVWTEDSGADDDIDVIVESEPDKKIRSDRHTVHHNTDVKTTGSMLVRKLTNVLT